MKRLAIILLLLSMYCCMSAQRTHSLELKLYGGRIVPHRSGMDALAQPLYAGEMNYYFSTRSDNYYDLKYHFPKHGFGLNYNYFGNHKVIGSAFAAYSFLDFSFLDKQWRTCLPNPQIRQGNESAEHSRMHQLVLLLQP